MGAEMRARKWGPRTAILRLESTRHLKGSLALTAVLTVFAALYLSIFPSFKADAEQLADAFPPFIIDMFRVEAIHTIEGFIAAEMYSFFWTVIVAAYFAYAGSTMIASDRADRRMDLTLSNPVSRESVVIQKVLAMWVPLVLLNGWLFLILLGGTYLIDEPLAPVALTMVHLLSIPYFLVCIGIGLLASVLFPHPRTSKAAAVALVIVLWFIDGVSRLTPDYEWIGLIAPSRYYHYTAILVREEYSLTDAGILLVTFLALVAIATLLFVRRDI